MPWVRSQCGCGGSARKFRERVTRRSDSGSACDAHYAAQRHSALRQAFSIETTKGTSTVEHDTSFPPLEGSEKPSINVINSHLLTDSTTHSLYSLDSSLSVKSSAQKKFFRFTPMSPIHSISIRFHFGLDSLVGLGL